MFIFRRKRKSHSQEAVNHSHTTSEYTKNHGSMTGQSVPVESRQHIPAVASTSTVSNPALDMPSPSRMRPSANRREVPMTSLTPSTKPRSFAARFPLPQMQPVSVVSGPRTELRNDSSELTAAMNSFTRLNPAERRAFVSMLHNLTAPEDSAGLTGEDSVVGAPPPYSN
jgi:hypothetical protein